MCSPLLAKMACCKVILQLFGILLLTVPLCFSKETWDRYFWYDNDKVELAAALQQPNMNKAKNLVLAIGDGMGLDTTTATRIYRGQLTEGMLGEEALLSWDKFPHTGLSKTYSTDMMIIDSAASATAYHCGVKTKYNAIGVDDTVERNDCSTVAAASVKSVMDHALAEGKSVGIVTTDALVGASPSGAYAHTAAREWRADFELPADAKGVCKDIARQLIEDNIDIQVLLGGGRKYFLPNTTTDPEDPTLMGARTDGMDLVQQWLTDQSDKGRKAKYVYDQAGFDEATADNTDYLLGMFEYDKLSDETDRRVDNKEPSIAQMTRRAIEILEKNPEGFYLFIEGGNIDIAHHWNRARTALEEGLALDDAVQTVMNMTSTDDTLVVVSADHSSALSFAGSQQRGQSILSVANNSYDPINLLDRFGNYYTILSYGNGPGYQSPEQRVDLTLPENHGYYDVDRAYMSTFYNYFATHGGGDVPIFASGPMSHIFTGVHEQTFIANGMTYAACIGRNKDHCVSSDAAIFSPILGVLVVLVVLQAVF